MWYHKQHSAITCFISAVLLLILYVPYVRAAEVPVYMTGVDFTGGAKELFGASQYSEITNYVYAQSTGATATMSATFKLGELPVVPMFLHIKGRDDDAPSKCAIEILLNGSALFRGKNDFSDSQWDIRKIPLPPGALKSGENHLIITNKEEAGQPGMPPWFMVASCAIAPGEFTMKPIVNITKDFFVAIPSTKHPLPEPLAMGEEAGFKIRGIKGWMWRPEQYLEEIPVLAEYKMNFLMNCYGSMCDIENYGWGDPQVNRWWEPLPEWKKEAYEKIVRASQDAGIQFCFSMNPNICTRRIVDYNSTEDIDLLWQHYAWMQSIGVKWFNISLDDISEGIDAAGQAKVVNEILRRLRLKDPDSRMIFCPTYYWGDGTGKEQQPYLEELAQMLDKDVYLFWTGDSVVGTISRSGAETFKGIAQHRIILWDNYPVNDNWPTMHLAPVTGRDPDLCEVIDGYMSNSMCTQNQANRIPLLTCADYAYNPKAYDPSRSIGQAIVHLAETREQQEALKDLVEAYAGMLLYGKGPNFNAVRERYLTLFTTPHPYYILSTYIRQMGNLTERFEKAFPERFGAAKKTLNDDIAWLKNTFTARYGESSLP